MWVGVFPLQFLLVFCSKIWLLYVVRVLFFDHYCFRFLCLFSFLFCFKICLFYVYGCGACLLPTDVKGSHCMYSQELGGYEPLCEFREMKPRSSRITTCSKPQAISLFGVLNTCVWVSLCRPGKFLAIIWTHCLSLWILSIPSTPVFRFGFLNIILFLRNFGSFFLFPLCMCVLLLSLTPIPDIFSSACFCVLTVFLLWLWWLVLSFLELFCEPFYHLSFCFIFLHFFLQIADYVLW